METKTKIVLTLVVGLGLTFASSLLVDLSGDGLRAVEDIRHGTDPFSKDTNGDGLTDYEEIKLHGTDPLKLDSNNDGLTDYEEVKIYGTDPLKNDTTGDGLTDYREVEVYGTDPTTPDTTGDGLSDYNEINVYGTDPTKKDTNGDGLTDYEEIIVYDTDPLEIDTNDDGLTDYEEIKIYGTDPLENDTNGDGLTDYEEVEVYGTDPTVLDTNGDGLSDYNEIRVYNTDPLEEDTNGDGLTDYEEIRVHGTDPLKNDTNGDGLTDYEEVEIYGTNPTELDTVGNGISDAKEVEIGTDPTKWDSSGDGYPDKLLYEKDGLEPTRLNVIVEAHHTSDSNIPKDMSELVETFDESPVTSDLGTKGINLKIYRSGELNKSGSVTLDQYINTTYSNSREMSDIGAHHALFVNRIPKDAEGTDVTGKTSSGIEGMLVESVSGESKHSKEVLMHEIGHQLGLWPWEVEGVDSNNYSWASYPSIMNYNSPSCTLIQIGTLQVEADDCSSEETIRFADSDWDVIQSKIEEENPTVELEKYKPKDME